MKLIDLNILGATSEVVVYTVAPYRCTIKGMNASVNADPGDAETITLSSGSNAVGVLTFGSDIAAGATGTYAANATYGDTVFEAGSVIKLTVTALTAAATFRGYIEIDEFARIDS